MFKLKNSVSYEILQKKPDVLIIGYLDMRSDHVWELSKKFDRGKNICLSCWQLLCTVLIRISINF